LSKFIKLFSISWLHLVTQLYRISLFLLILFAPTIQVYSQKGKWKSASSCCSCRPCKNFDTQQAYNEHVCSVHGVDCAPKPVVNDQGDKEEDALRESEGVDVQQQNEDEEKRKKEEREKSTIDNKQTLERMNGSSPSSFGIGTKASPNGLKDKQTNDFGLKSSTSNEASLPPKYQSYLSEVDHTEVPPPSWQSIINLNVEQLRIGQASDKNKHLMLFDNALVSAFDLRASPVSASGAAGLAGFKVLIIGAKSAIAAMDEAEVIVFAQNEQYETVLLYLKDKTKRPQLLTALKSIREKKPFPPGISPEIMMLAAATQSPAEGISTKHIVMNAMLSTEAKWAFFQTAKMEGMELLNNGIRGLVGTAAQNRFRALCDANEKITTGQTFLATEKDPLLRSIVEGKLKTLEEKMAPFDNIPEGILSFISLYEDYKKIMKQQ
jgi:hypothetical protein